MRVRLGAIDDIALDVAGTVIEVLGADPLAPEAAEEDDDDSAAAGPIAIAVDVTEAEAPNVENPAP